MRNKILLLSNLYATFFFALMCHWAISYCLGWDLFESTYNFIYADWLYLPHVSLIEAITQSSGILKLEYFFGYFWLYPETTETVYLIVMFFCSLISMLASIIGWAGYAFRKYGLAIIAALLYAVMALAMPHAIIYTIPLVCLGFASCATRRAM